MLSAKEILQILDLITKVHGPGYAKDTEVSKLQAKLSIMLEVARRKEAS